MKHCFAHSESDLKRRIRLRRISAIRSAITGAGLCLLCPALLIGQWKAAPQTLPEVPGGALESIRTSLEPVDFGESGAKAKLLAETDMPALRQVIEAILANHPLPAKLPDRLHTPGEPIYFSFRSNGRRIAHYWMSGETVLQALQSGLRPMRLYEWPSGEKQTIELVFTHSYERRSLRTDRRSVYSNIHRGIRGLEIGYRGYIERYSPTYAIASNRDNERLIELFLKRWRLPKTAQMDLEIRTFAGEQVLFQFGEPSQASLMYRGNELVPIEEVDQASVQELSDLAANWLVRNIHDNGRMTYKYWPSAVRESTANNMIRQWMATVALNKTAQRRGDPALWKAVATNIDYNLQQFYREEEGFGLIEWRNSVKLGAVALAAMAILEHPEREKWQEHETALQRTIDHLWNEDGSFRTFYRPSTRNDNQNFYPGEALFYWAMLYDENRDSALLEKIEKSFDYYRDWHLKSLNRNPAFIPWHTQAYKIIWSSTRNEEMKDFIFEMNDWLVEMMLEWKADPPFPDTQGRYYNPSKPYGVPHASSTGVYLEGLIDAYWLAREVGETERAERYRIAMVRGLRSVMQLQFVDEIDMFYVVPREYRYVKGGIRTTVYDNEIRCDNVQHNLMALYKILDILNPEDYAHPGG